MGYYALLLPAYVGHLNPMAALGRTLQKRGHRVCIVAPLDAESPARRAGLEFIPLAEHEFPAGEWERSEEEVGKLTGLRAQRCATRSLAQLSRGIVRDLPSIISKEQFDGLVMDHLALGAEDVCRVMDLPLAVACNALPLHAEPRVPPLVFSWTYTGSLVSCIRNLAGYAVQNSAGWPLVKEIMPYRKQHGLGFPRYSHYNHIPPSLVQISQTPEFLDYPRRFLPRHFHYTGPWVESNAARQAPPFPWERLDGRPLIYASLGTLQNGLDQLYSLILTACSGLNAQLVLALGRKDAVSPAGNGNAIVVGYAPQLQLLERAALVVSHAGLNTTLESLRVGVPMVLLPITNDQPGIAARLQRFGAGRFIPLRKATPQRLRGTMQLVLESPSYREQSRKAAQQLARIDGLGRAAELLEQAFTSRQMVCRQ
jgi:MGT family glycosyltransferase